LENLKYSFFQLTFGEEEAFLQPEKTYQRLSKYGYDAIEIAPPKGHFSSEVEMDDYLKTHKKLKNNYNLEVSAVNECWGEEWDPFSPAYKTLTEPETAQKAISETKSTIDFASELGAPFVTVAVAIHDEINENNVQKCTEIAVKSLQQMAEYASKKNVSLVFEATNFLEMGKYVNTIANHKRIIELTGKENIGIQIDWFHVNIEELNVYEAVMDARDLLWHLHFRDSNSLTPGYGSIDFKTILRALKKINYKGYCTIESAPMIPDPEVAARDGIEYLKMMERIVEFQLSPEFPNGYKIKM